MLLEALKCKNTDRPPVWLMRQAGRYLPSYRKLREKHSLKSLFFTPDLAAEITLMPIQQIGVDAAILFSDITVIAMALGYDLEFNEGPVITGSLKPLTLEPLSPIRDTILQIKKRSTVPLIGFCGGPYTVASYMGGDPKLLEPLTEATLQYIRMQEDAGVDAIQIFDSWANRLSDLEFQTHAAPYLQRLIEAARVPTILFMRGACARVKELVHLNPSAISFDWEKPLHTLRPHVPMAVQGNLNPDLLYESLPVIQTEVKQLLANMGQDPGFIVNLGHGLKPDMSVDAVRCFVETVQGYS